MVKMLRKHLGLILLVLAFALVPVIIQKTRIFFAPLVSSYPTFDLLKVPQVISPISFTDERGQERSLSAFKGKLLVVNIWATWCPPCREEMPTLDRLQTILGESVDFEVIAISVDAGGRDIVRAFYANNGITKLPILNAPENETLARLGIVGLPTTILVNPNGLELGRILGPAKWDSPEMLR